MSRKVFVAGIGMIPFVRPGQHLPCHEMGAEAARLPPQLAAFVE